MEALLDSMLVLILNLVVKTSMLGKRTIKFVRLTKIKFRKITTLVTTIFQSGLALFIIDTNVLIKE